MYGWASWNRLLIFFPKGWQGMQARRSFTMAWWKACANFWPSQVVKAWFNRALQPLNNCGNLTDRILLIRIGRYRGILLGFHWCCHGRFMIFDLPHPDVSRECHDVVDPGKTGDLKDTAAILSLERMFMMHCVFLIKISYNLSLS